MADAAVLWELLSQLVELPLRNSANRGLIEQIIAERDLSQVEILPSGDEGVIHLRVGPALFYVFRGEGWVRMDPLSQN